MTSTAVEFSTSARGCLRPDGLADLVLTEVQPEKEVSPTARYKIVVLLNSCIVIVDRLQFIVDMSNIIIF